MQVQEGQDPQTAWRAVLLGLAPPRIYFGAWPASRECEKSRAVRRGQGHRSRRRGGAVRAASGWARPSPSRLVAPEPVVPPALYAAAHMCKLLCARASEQKPVSWGQREGGVCGHWSTGRTSHVRMPRTQTQAQPRAQAPRCWLQLASPAGPIRHLWNGWAPRLAGPKTCFPVGLCPCFHGAALSLIFMVLVSNCSLPVLRCQLLSKALLPSCAQQSPPWEGGQSSPRAAVPPGVRGARGLLCPLVQVFSAPRWGWREAKVAASGCRAPSLLPVGGLPFATLLLGTLCKNVFLIQMSVVPAAEMFTCYGILGREKRCFRPLFFTKWATEFWGGRGRWACPAPVSQSAARNLHLVTGEARRTLSDSALCLSEGWSEKTRAERDRQHRTLVGPGSPLLSLPPLTTVQEVWVKSFVFSFWRDPVRTNPEDQCLRSWKAPKSSPAGCDGSLSAMLKRNPEDWLLRDNHSLFGHGSSIRCVAVILSAVPLCAFP